jgi:hypothetical protein
MICAFCINIYRLQKLQSTFTFSDAKAREDLGWNPNSVIENLWCFLAHK